MESIIGNPLFGIFFTGIMYYMGVLIGKKFHTPLANPLLIATIISVIVMKLLHISYKNYMVGGQFISMLIGPATAMLGLLIYRQRNVLQEQFLPIVIGCGIGSGVSIGSTYGLCTLAGLHHDLMVSMFPKSVTTAIALDLSEQLGGVSTVTLISVIICGIMGAILNPLLINIFHIKDSVAIGVGMGTASHAIGTSKALEMGELSGAVSGVSIGVAGIWTVIIIMIFIL